LEACHVFINFRDEISLTLTFPLEYPTIQRVPSGEKAVPASFSEPPFVGSKKRGTNFFVLASRTIHPHAIQFPSFDIVRRGLGGPVPRQSHQIVVSMARGVLGSRGVDKDSFVTGVFTEG
jgi:hypothetical protein